MLAKTGVRKISSVACGFNNYETPIICYKYNKPIRSTTFNINKIVTDINKDSKLLTPVIVKILIVYIRLLGM